MAEKKGKPLTRKDLLKLIEENGGTAEGLDLSGKVFEEGIDLSSLDLQGIILNGAELLRANLERANLEGAELQVAQLQGAILMDANLQTANLLFAKLQGTFLSGAKLQDAWLLGVELSSDTILLDADWGNYILIDEKEEHFPPAAITYRRLKQWYTNAGMYDEAGKFYYREMEAKRKELKWWPKPWHRAWSKFLSLICGYGERPLRVVISAVVVVFGLAAIYFFLGAFSSGTFAGCLYYSVVSFTALGYGSWVFPEPESWAKGLGAAEAALGVFMIALFLVTFVRKMTR